MKSSFFTGDFLIFSGRTRIKDVYAGDVKKALLSDDPRTDALEELIAVGEAVFIFIRYSDLDLPLRNAVGVMEKQFDFYRRLLGRHRSQRQKTFQTVKSNLA